MNNNEIKTLKIKLYNNENYLPYDYDYDQSELLLAVWTILVSGFIPELTDFLKTESIGERYFVGNCRIRIMDSGIMRLIKSRDSIKPMPDFYLDIQISRFIDFLKKYQEFELLKVNALILKRQNNNFDIEIFNDSEPFAEEIVQFDTGIKEIKLVFEDEDDNDPFKIRDYRPFNTDANNSDTLIIVWSAIYHLSMERILNYLIYNNERGYDSIKRINRTLIQLINVENDDEFKILNDLDEEKVNYYIMVDYNNFLNFMIKYYKVDMQKYKFLVFKIIDSKIDVEIGGKEKIVY